MVLPALIIDNKDFINSSYRHAGAALSEVDHSGIELVL